MRLPSSVFVACSVVGSQNAPAWNDSFGVTDVDNVQSSADVGILHGHDAVLLPKPKYNCYSNNSSGPGAAKGVEWGSDKTSYCCENYGVACPNARFFVLLTKKRGETRHISPDDVKAALEKELPEFKGNLFVDYATAEADESKFKVIVTKRLEKDQVQFLRKKITDVKLSKAMFSDIKGVDTVETEFDTRFQFSHGDVVEAAFEIILQIVAFLIAIYLWNTRIYPEKQQMPEFIDTLGRGDFKSSICGCINDPDSCVLGFVAPIPRLVDNYLTADTIARSDACSTASTIFCCFMFLPTAVIPLCCYMPYKRAQVRRKMGGRSTWYIDDLLATTACFCCHVCQMAREVDRAAGWTTTAICDLRELEPEESTVGYATSVTSRRYSRLSESQSPASWEDRPSRRPSRVSHANR
eukprot:GEMP01024340.1.p1 GENE.GEMP01024340.1~~GEMP01024340.1.p1  ORF type:complete len:410 (+),score=71.33 GEMP01024340.1:256-1485(+)